MKLIEKNQADTQTNAACEAEKFPNPVDDIVPGWSIDPVTGERFLPLRRELRFSPAPAAFGRLLATGLRPRSAGGLKSCPRGAIVTGRASSV